MVKIKQLARRCVYWFGLNKDIEERVNLFLFNYRNSSLEGGGLFPSEKLLSFKPKLLIDLLNPKHDYKNQLTKPLHVEPRKEDHSEV